MCKNLQIVDSLRIVHPRLSRDVGKLFNIVFCVFLCFFGAGERQRLYLHTEKHRISSQDDGISQLLTLQILAFLLWTARFVKATFVTVIAGSSLNCESSRFSNLGCFVILFNLIRMFCNSEW